MDRHFFNHDFYARQDEKLKRLRIKHGLAGIGAFWCITEMLYENNGSIEYDSDIIADELRCDSILIQAVVENFGLFDVSNNQLTSKRVCETLKKINDKCEKAKKAVLTRWRNEQQQQIQFDTDETNNNTDVKKINTNVSNNNTDVQNNNTTVSNNKINKYECNTDVIRTNYERNTDERKNDTSCNTDKIRRDKKRREKEEESVCSIAHTRTHTHTHVEENPELIDVLQYAEEQMFNRQDAENFFNHYDAQGWLTGNNMPIKNWQSKLKTWCHENELRRIADVQNSKQMPAELADLATQALRSRSNAQE